MKMLALAMITVLLAACSGVVTSGAGGSGTTAYGTPQHQDERYRGGSR